MTSPRPTLRAIVVAHDSAAHLPATLEALRAQLEPGDELVVVDTASADESVAAARAAAPAAQVVELGTNAGFAGGAVAGAQQAATDLLFFLNPDAIVAPGCLDALRTAAAEHPGWGAWQPLVLLEDGRRVNVSGGITHWLGLAWAGGYGEDADGDRPSHPVSFASGAALVVRRDAWEATGGFDERYFMYGEDVDLSLRLRLAGWEVGAVPAARVTHDYAFEKGDYKWFHLERNRWWTVLATYPAALLALVLPALLALELVLLPVAAAGGWLGAKLRAQAAVVRSLPWALRRRRRVQRSRRVSSSQFAGGLASSLDSPFLGRAGRLRPVVALQAAYWRAVRAVVRTPRPLGAMLAATFVLGAAWAVVVPPFQSPDEGQHIAYLQELAEDFKLPGQEGFGMYAFEETLASDLGNGDQTAGNPLATPSWSPTDERSFREQADALTPEERANGGGGNPAAPNPPGFYAYGAVAYHATVGGDLMDRTMTVRMASVLWLLVTVACTWLLVGELTGRRRELQLLGAGAVALLPMTHFMSASVSPDGMLYGTWTLALWLGVRLLRRGLTPARSVAFLAAVGLACLVKATSYALLPGAALVMLIALWRARRQPIGRLVGAAGLGAGTLAVMVGSWVALARSGGRPASSQLSTATGTDGTEWREFLSYLWQFYLPRLDSMVPMQNLPPDQSRLYEAWIKQGWGAFGWQEVRFPDWLYSALFAASAIVVVAALVSLWTHRRRLDWGALAFCGLAAVTLLLGLHYTEYRQLNSGGPPLTQGRYLLPLAGVAGCAFALALALVPRRAQPGTVAVLLGLLFTVNLVGLGLVLERFHA